FLFNSLNAVSIENELGINMGVTSINNKSGPKFKNYGFGMNYQLNRYVVMPRFDLDYVKISDYADKSVKNLFRGSINGVYEFENRTQFNPYVIAGLGYEHVSSEIKDVFESHPFIQGGLGVNYSFMQGYKLRVESKMLQILNGNNENNEIMMNFGFSVPLKRIFYKPQKTPKPKVIIRRQTIIKRVPIIKEVKVPVRVPVRVNNIDTNSCPKKIDGADIDRDGIADYIDQCPATPCGSTVDRYGCPIKMTLKINFAVNSSYIEDYSIPKIRNFANYLLSNRETKVVIVGHTDSDGSSASNLTLSRDRAYAVANKLIEFGVNNSRITAKGMGESMPIASNVTKEGKRLNRRIEAILIYPKR
ncbi:MAG TPA: OmpA family protein, partial [Campylobacterales bacterium]|nr:OmpA family protein [Campylobacterales bacterium]